MTKANISGSKQRQINAVVTGVVTAKLAMLDAAAGDRLLQKLDTLRERVEPGITAILDDLSVDAPPKLKLVNSNIHLGTVDNHDPVQFYQTRSGLYVWPEFKSRVLSSTAPVKDLAGLSLSSFDLTENLYDRDIKANLPANHVFGNTSELCARIAQMISKQPNGEAGDLLSNGYANLFYVAGCVVFVFWFAGGREWDVDAGELDFGYWSAGYRAFSSN